MFNEPLPQQQGEPAQFAHYPTPGLTLFGTLPQGPVRGIRQATNGQIYAVGGSSVYVVSLDGTSTLLGGITAGLTTPVSMQDNTLTLVIVDGTTGGWQVDLASNAFSAITDSTGMFSGADRVDYLDTYLLFNKPGTPQFYASNSLAVTFDTLFFANKSSYTDNLRTLAVAKREIWLLGERTTEIWYNAGPVSTTDAWPFAEMQSTFIDHGCVAKYTVVTYDNAVFWLSADRTGAPLAMQGAGYQTKRISTFALEQAWADYTITDAIGFIYQLGGHAVYVLTFPTSDHTWCYDISAGLWHEWLWVDSNGNEHRSRAMCAYPLTTGLVLVGDWQNGNIYHLDHNNFTDNGAPIKRQRSWQHVLNEGKRVFHREFIADIECGLGGPQPSQGSTLVQCFWRDAPYGTLVDDYVPTPGEVNAIWYIKMGPGAEIDVAGAIAVNGPTAYMSPVVPSIADYSISFRVTPNAPEWLNGQSALVAGRATGMVPTGWMDGYIAGIQIIDGVWCLVLGNNTVQIGAPPPDGWFDCLLTMIGSSIFVSVQRSSDGLWIDSTGIWRSTATAAISVTDTTYTAPGRIMFGLNANPTGYMGTEADVNSFWVVEDGSNGAWEWDEVPTDSLGITNIEVSLVATPWQLLLDWSDDRGHTYGIPVPQTMGGQGDYFTSVQWQRLGYSRDKVFRLTWTAPIRTALLGAWIEVQPALS